MYRLTRMERYGWCGMRGTVDDAGLLSSLSIQGLGKTSSGNARLKSGLHPDPPIRVFDHLANQRGGWHLMGLQALYQRCSLVFGHRNEQAA